MATWITHMRIAEYFMAKYHSLNNKIFLVGSIGPDCGVPKEDWSKFLNGNTGSDCGIPNENWSKYTPPPAVTHWKLGEKKTTIDAEGFRQSYLQREKDEKYPFYLGYYLHLLTDIEWAKLYERKKQEPLYAQGLAADDNFIWAAKKDWYGQDHVYLQTHADSVFHREFSKIGDFPNIYLDFYSNDAFTRQIKHITAFYSSANEDLDRNFPFLSKEEMNDFVNSAIKTLEDAANANGLMEI